MKVKKVFKKVFYKFKVYMEFLRESRYFCKYYTYASNRQKNLEYRMLMLIHSIEKGMCTTNNIRPFGKEKVTELMDVIRLYSKKNYPREFAFNLALSVLEEYQKFYEENNFIDECIYHDVTSFLNVVGDFPKIDCGAEEYVFKNPNCDVYSLLSSRHSIRKFSNLPVDRKDIDYAVDCAIQSPSACNRQMVQAYCFFSGTSQIDIINRYAQGLSGFDKKNMNYFVITYDESALLFPGERNQGMLNAGLFCTNLVNALHSRGIGTCFIQYANSFQEECSMKKELGISSCERVAVLIAFGTYDGSYLVPKSMRKTRKDVLKVMQDE